jgi:vacuolar-type H+-ATPase subunit E/Vma4
MTSIEELQQSIIGDAREKAARIESETRSEVERIAQETESMLQARRTRLHLDAEAAQHARVQQLQARKHLAAHRKVLEEKQAVLNAVFAEAAQTIAQLPPGQRKRLLDSLWANATGVMIPASVTCDPKDEQYFKGKASVTTQPMAGGFIATSKDGRQRLDLRVETLLDDMKERRTEVIARALFGGGR